MKAAELKRELARALRSDLPRARRLLRRYVRLADAGTPLDRADARFQQAQCDHVAGRLATAADAYADARRRFGRLRARREAFATDVGAIQVSGLQGRRDRVARIARRLRAGANEPLASAYAEIAIGAAYHSLGDERVPERSYRRALEQLGRQRNERARRARATARLHLGMCLARRGAVRQAVDEFERAHAAFERDGLAANAEMARHNGAWARALGGDLASAAAEFAACREAFARRGDRRRVALVLLDEAEVALRLGDAAGAAGQAQRAATALRRQEVSLEAGRAALVAARAQRQLGRSSRARKVAAQARELFVAGGDAAGAAAADTILGERLARAERTLRRTGHLLSALEALLVRARALGSRAGADLLARASREYPTSLRRWVAPEIHSLRADADPKRRIPLLRQAVRASEEVRRCAPTGRLRAASMATNLGVYRALAQALWERGDAAARREAFLVLDAARARTLSEAAGSKERPSRGSAADLRRQIEEHWAALERLDGEAGDLRRAQRALLGRVARLERRLLASLEADSGPARGAEQSPAGPCLAFTVFGRRLVALSYRDGEVTSWSCGSLRTIMRELARFRFEVARHLHAGAAPERANARLAALAERLFPAGSEIPRGRVTLVPAPEIGDLPFEALPVAEGLLGEQARICYAACARPGPRRKRRSGAVLIGGDDRGLPAVATELRALGSRLPRAQLVPPSSATMDSVLASIEGAGLVHLAGHVDARPDQPMMSAFRLRDGWLAAADLAGSDLEGALVVLSTCRSGNPGLTWRGESLAGFPRALLAAGASVVVASRWEVRDEVARAFMVRFHRELENNAPEDALERAQRFIRGQFPHPADWAAFLSLWGGSLPAWDGMLASSY